MNSIRLVVIVAFLSGSLGTVIAQDPFILISEEVFFAKVVQVSQTGTLHLTSDGRKLELRLASIRLPERESSIREKADKLLRHRLVGRSVEVHLRTYGSRGEAWTGYTLLNELDPRLELVAEGFARYCPRYLQEPELERGQTGAKAAARGIWSEEQRDDLPQCEEAA